MTKHKAYVLHSGGIDSTTCLYMAIDMCGPQNVIGVSIDYGQRHRKEIDQAELICNHVACRHEVVSLTVPPTMLTDPTEEIPNITYEEIKGVSPTYVPFRNGQLLSKIAGIAVVGIRAEGDTASIWFGAHAEDAANWAYPDCSPEFIGAMSNAIYVGTYHQVRLMTPLMFMMKYQIIHEGQKLRVPWPATWSCYAGGDLHCGACPTCYARHRAFLQAEVLDPTTYATLPNPL